MSKETKEKIEKDLDVMTLLHLTYSLNDSSKDFLNKYLKGVDNKNLTKKYIKKLKEVTQHFADVFDHNTTKARNEAAQLQMVSQTDILQTTLKYLVAVDKEKQELFLEGVKELSLIYAKK